MVYSVGQASTLLGGGSAFEITLRDCAPNRDCDGGNIGLKMRDNGIRYPEPVFVEQNMVQENFSLQGSDGCTGCSLPNCITQDCTCDLLSKGVSDLNNNSKELNQQISNGIVDMLTTANKDIAKKCPGNPQLNVHKIINGLAKDLISKEDNKAVGFLETQSLWIISILLLIIIILTIVLIRKQ